MLEGRDQMQPGGLPESSRWSQSPKATGTRSKIARTPQGCQNIQPDKRYFSSYS
jgi:hypothetical protein